MARYLGPKLKLSRREGTDLFLKAAFAQSILNVKSIQRLVNMVPVVAVCLTTVFSCVKTKKYVVCMAYWKSNSVTTTKKLHV